MMTFVVSIICHPVRIVKVCVTESGVHELAVITGGTSTEKSLLLAHERLGIKLSDKNTSPYCTQGSSFTRLRQLIPGGNHEVTLK